jgi:hypothetical protein
MPPQEETEKRLHDLLESCCKRGLDLDAESWGMMREISEQTREYADWIEMEDGDTKNMFYAKKIVDEETMLKEAAAASTSPSKTDTEEKKDDAIVPAEGGKEEEKDDAALEAEKEEQKKIRERRLMMKAPVLQDEKDEASACTWKRSPDFNIKAKIREAWSYVRAQNAPFIPLNPPPPPPPSLPLAATCCRTPRSRANTARGTS